MVRWALLAGARDFYSVLAALVSPEQNIFFITLHYISIHVPIAKQPPVVVHGHLSLNLSLREQVPPFLLSKSFSSMVPNE
jgi:hypothetical protein